MFCHYHCGSEKPCFFITTVVMKKPGFSSPLPPSGNEKARFSTTTSKRVSEFHYHLGRTGGAQFQSLFCWRSSLPGIELHHRGQAQKVRRPLKPVNRQTPPPCPTMATNLKFNPGGLGFWLHLPPPQVAPSESVPPDSSSSSETFSRLPRSKISSDFFLPSRLLLLFRLSPPALLRSAVPGGEAGAKIANPPV